MGRMIWVLLSSVLFCTGCGSDTDSNASDMGADYTDYTIQDEPLECDERPACDPGPGANCHCADLSRTDLSGANLSGADFSGATFVDADLSGADLAGANLTWANLYDTDLRDSNLRFADISGAELSNANLEAADLLEAVLVGANLTNANLSQVNLKEADLSGATLDGVIWYDTTCPDNTNSSEQPGETCCQNLLGAETASGCD